jgi:hypothetical protein
MSGTPQPTATTVTDLEALTTVSLSEQGAFLHLTHPGTGLKLNNGDGQPMGLLLRGKDSTVVAAKEREISQRRIDGALAVGRRPRIDANSLNVDAIELLVAATKEVRNLVLRGQPVANTPQAFTQLYTDFPWIREQVDTFIADRANFLGK